MSNSVFFTYFYCRETAREMIKLVNELPERGGSFYLILSSLAFSAFTIESFINHCGQTKFSDWYRWDKDNHPNLEVKLKRLKIEKIVFGSEFSELFKLRDQIVHGKTIFHSDDFSKKIPISFKGSEKLLRNSFEEQIKLNNAKRYLTLVDQWIDQINLLSGINFPDAYILYGAGEGDLSY